MKLVHTLALGRCRGGFRGEQPPVRDPPPLPQVKILVSVTGHLGLKNSDYMLVYVKNCIFVHMTNKIFPVTPLETPGSPLLPPSGGAKPLLGRRVVIFSVPWGWTWRGAALIPCQQRDSQLSSVPPIKLYTVGSRVFPVAAVQVWNDLSEVVVSSSSLQTFRQNLKTHLFSKIVLPHLILDCWTGIVTVVRPCSIFFNF